MGIHSLQSQQVLKAADGVRNRASQVVVGQISAQDNDLSSLANHVQCDK